MSVDVQDGTLGKQRIVEVQVSPGGPRWRFGGNPDHVVRITERLGSGYRDLGFLSHWDARRLGEALIRLADEAEAR